MSHYRDGQYRCDVCGEPVINHNPEMAIKCIQASMKSMKMNPKEILNDTCQATNEEEEPGYWIQQAKKVSNEN